MPLPMSAATGADEFRLIADSAPVPMWMTRLDRRRSFVNRAYVEFLGVDEAAALDFDWRTILHPDDAERIVRESLAGEASLAVFSLQARYRRGDGRWRWLQSISQPRRDAEGRHIGFVGVAIDITEAKTAELALREREEQLSAIVDQTTAGFAQVDLTGRFTLVNDRFCEIVGRSRDELLGLTMQAITHPDDLPRNLPLFERAVREGMPYGHEKRYVRPDGAIVWVNNSVAVIRRADDTPYGVLAVTLDVTARREAETALRRTEESMRLAIEGAGMATWALDLATMAGPWSANRFDLLGYPRAADGCGTFDEWLACVHPDDLDRARAAAERCFRDGAPLEIEYRIRRADTGDVRWLQSHGSRIDQDGRSPRFVGVSFDVTARKRIDETLREDERRLAFLDSLGRATAAATDADDVLAITTRMLGEHLRLSDCAYADMEDDEDRFHIRGDWHTADVPSIVGSYSLAAFGSLAVANLRAGEPLVVNDNVAELGEDGSKAFLDIGIRATVCMPLVKRGRLTALMAIHDKMPRRWTAAEIALLGEVAERSWAHIERVRSEAALRESERHLRLAIEGARIGTWDWDLVARLGSWSPRAAEIMGVDPGQPVTPELRFSLVHPEDRGRVSGQVADLMAAGDEFASEYRVLRPDGEVRWVSSRGVIIRDEDGRIVRTTGTIRDVTRRREAQDALAALNRTLEQQVAARTAERDRMWQLSHDLLLVIGRRWDVRAVNPAVATLGYRAAEVVGKRLDRFIHPDDLGAVRAAIRAAAAGDGGEFPARLQARDGGWRHYSWSAAPGGGEAYVIGRDVTAEVLRREELELAREALRQAQKVESLGQLTGGVAHDFNNLLTPIIGSLDLLRHRAPLGERERRLVDGALESAERARTLVQRLLAFARRQPLRPGPVDLGTLIDGMAGLIDSTSGPQVKVQVDVAPDLPPALGDANQFEMAILNLSVNSRDAMPNGGTLTLAAKRAPIAAGDASGLAAGEYLRLSVSDTGVGMDDDVRARAIEPFFSTKGIGKGTGLGLSMVHGLASQLGGAMVLASRPGVGTTVELLLPIASGSAAAADAGTTAAGHPPPAGHALLVDDEEPVRAAVADMLSDLGYVVAEAASPDAALAMLRDRCPDVLVSDHLMPGMTGAELARHARAIHPALPVLIVSGYAELEGIPRDLDRLAKPFRRDELAAALATLASEVARSG